MADDGAVPASEMQSRALLPMLFSPHRRDNGIWGEPFGKENAFPTKQNVTVGKKIIRGYEGALFAFTMTSKANMQEESPKQSWNSALARRLVGDVGAAVASATLVAPAVTIIDRYVRIKT